MKKSIFVFTFLTLGFGVSAFASANIPFAINCEISSDGLVAVSRGGVDYVEYRGVYGQLYRGHEIRTAQSGNPKAPTLKLFFRKSEPTLEKNDVINFGFVPGEFKSALIGDFLNGIQEKFEVNGNQVAVGCSADIL